MIRENYPFETYHEMNLDWLLNRVKELEKKEDGCQCDTDSIKREIQIIKDQIQSIQNVNEYQQREIEALQIPIMQKKDFALIWNGINFNMKAKTFGKEAL